MDSRKYLTSLESEVDDLHELLKFLLRKLPGIRDVEYTHGPSEFGADFIVHKDDPTLGKVNYVGVVAKLTKITKSSNDVFQQIEECHMPRKADSGKRNVHLTEVWIITPNTISNHAKELIHHKYASTNVQFIGREMLADWLDRYAPEMVSNATPAIINYFSETVGRANANTPSNGLLADLGELPRIELEYDRLELDESGYAQERKATTPRAELERSRVIWLEAPMGFGKTRTLMDLLVHYADPDVYGDVGVVPIHTTFREFFEDYDASLARLVTDRTQAIGADIADKAEYLVLVDGVDELLCEDESILQILDDVLAEARGQGIYRLVIASRPVRAGYIEAFRATDITNVEIRPLSFKKLIEFINAACADLSMSSRLAEDLRRSNLLRQLPHSPIAAILLSRVLREDPKDLPANLTELYAKAIELMLGRWDISKELFRQIEVEVAETVSGDIAKHVIDYGRPAVTHEEFRQFFHDYLRKRNLEIDADALSYKLLQRCDVYSQSSDGMRVWFTHRSFAEFLYAKAVYKEQKNLTVSKKAFEDYWMTTYFFYVGLRRDCPEYLRELMEIQLDSEYHKWMRVVHMANYYLAAFSTEYGLVKGELYKVFIEAARLYLYALSNTDETVFRKLTTIQVLFIFQFVVRHSYSFEFFADALEDAAEKLVKADISDEERIYSCFFLSATCMELGKDNALDVLVQHFDLGSLPLPVRLGISQEAKQYAKKKQIPAALKKHNKKFRQMRRANQGRRDKLDHYFETPLQRLK